MPENWRQFAWHCILDMADPMTVPETYGYGITETARTNLHATLEGMDAREQVIMLTEFLRVISHILMDVSMGIQNSVDAQNDEVNVEVEESSLVQKEAAKKVSKADGHKRKPAAGQNMEESNKKSKALEPAKAASALGTRLETMVRTLLAAMDKMKVDEARACAQVFFNRLQVLYQGGLQAEMTPTWPLMRNLSWQDWLPVARKLGSRTPSSRGRTSTLSLTGGQWFCHCCQQGHTQ